MTTCSPEASAILTAAECPPQRTRILKQIRSIAVSSLAVCAANMANSSSASRSFAFIQGIINSKILPVSMLTIKAVVMKADRSFMQYGLTPPYCASICSAVRVKCALSWQYSGTCVSHESQSISPALTKAV